MNTPLGLAVRFIGLAMACVGIATAGWVAFNLFVHQTPEFAAATQGTDYGGMGLVVGFVLAVVGGAMACGRRSAGDGPFDTGRTTETQDPVDRGIDPKLLDDIRVIAQGGRKIEAIKMYRQASGAGLYDAKQAVEALVRESA